MMVGFNVEAESKDCDRTAVMPDDQEPLFQSRPRVFHAATVEPKL